MLDEEERFATAVAVLLDPATGSVEWVNAGHEPPVLRRAGAALDELHVTGPLVCSLTTYSCGAWETGRTMLGPGDLLVCHTDGLSEARNGDGDLLGGDAVRRVLRELPRPTPQEAVRALHLAADRHDTDWTRDDITILAAALTP
ncbi:PP2C family protein-serine/threonine phosphatase [Kitasatospora sp. NPDC058406]|uniref:PP2C family protein-serine/threonine phosphatase n=1 Tax=Kitasatospora sp. NPDC058406 TaxID=3346483 RepID=UPI00364D2091